MIADITTQIGYICIVACRSSQEKPFFTEERRRLVTEFDTGQTHITGTWFVNIYIRCKVLFPIPI